MLEVHDEKDLRFGLPSSVANEIEDVGLTKLNEYCHFLYRQALHANTELAILRELKAAPAKYERDVICAPCFFSFARMAITESCFMNCARLFDQDSDLSIGMYLECCKEKGSEIDARTCVIYGDRPCFECARPIKHPLATDEERFFLEEVKNQQHIEELWGDGERNPVPINLDTASLVELWRKRLNGLSKLTDRLRGQRNKVFAHSDREALDYGGLVEKLPITYGDMQRLIDFALDVTIEMNAAVSGVVWPRLMGGSNDLRGLLNYVNAGMGWVERAVS